MTVKIPFAVKKAGNRGYHLVMDMDTKVLSWPKPELVVGAGCTSALPKIVQKCGIKKVIIVTDPRVAAIVQTAILPHFDALGGKYHLLTKVCPNPTDKIVEDITQEFKANGCDGMLAIGGGSPMDAAKGALVRIARPLTVMKKTLPLIAVPTTSGSGSEVSIVSVVVEDATRHKVAVTDPVLSQGAR